MGGIILLFIITILISAKGTTVEIEDSKENLDEAKIWRRESGKDGSGRIIGVKEAPKHGYPSAVVLFSHDNFNCAGTIVHEEWILIAAHCVQHGGPRNFKFSAGKHYLSVIETTEQHVSATAVHTHKEFDRAHFINDIVLFKVTPPFKFNEFVNKATLPDPESEPNGVATVVGWGVLKEDGTHSSDALQEVNVTIGTNEECAKSYAEPVDPKPKSDPESVFKESKSSHSILPGMICEVNEKGGKDSCKGDSEGPLYKKEGDKQILIGIVSYGEGCARPGFPGVYTMVSKYIAWMEETTGLDFRGPPDYNKNGKSCICLTFEE